MLLPNSHVCPVGSISIVHGQDIRELGSFEMGRPGFTELYEHSNPADPTERYSFIVSTFNPIPGTVDEVFFVTYPGKYLDDPSATQYGVVGDHYTWPREPDHIPEEVFGFNQALAVTDGFLLIGKNNGTLWLADIRDPTQIINTDIVRRPDDANIWFYHGVTWLDADGDGLIDLFSCRARQENLPTQHFSEFFWLKNPGGDNPIQTGPWEMTLISENDCDTFQKYIVLEAGGSTYTVIFTIGYFMNKFSVYWTNDPNGLWTDPAMIESRLIGELTDDADCVPGESYCGHFFDVVIDDINTDGRPDLLVTINSEVYGHLVVYQIPDDFRTGEYVVHTIAEGFIPTSGLQGGGSPGSPQTFYPMEFTAGKPWLLLSGDDDGKTYYLIPTTQSPVDWSYTLVEFLNEGQGTIVGKPVAFDSNGDGFTEVFVPAWSNNVVKVFTFAP